MLNPVWTCTADTSRGAAVGCAAVCHIYFGRRRAATRSAACHGSRFPPCTGMNLTINPFVSNIQCGRLPCAPVRGFAVLRHVRMCCFGPCASVKQAVIIGAQPD